MMKNRSHDNSGSSPTTRPAGVQQEDPQIPGNWFARRSWGWVSTPRVLGPCTVVGGWAVRIFQFRPDLPSTDIDAVHRYLAYKYGTLRILVPLAAAVILMGLLAGVLSVEFPWPIVAGLMVAALVDLLTLRVLRARAATGLDGTRSATCQVVPGQRRVLKKDVPGELRPEEPAIVADLLDQISALHQDHLLDQREWEAARWWTWDVLGTSPRSRAAIGWSPLIERLDGLIAQAAHRSA